MLVPNNILGPKNVNMQKKVLISNFFGVQQKLGSTNLLGGGRN